MKHSVVFFDLGGVVVEVESDRLILQVSQVLGRPFDEVHAAVYHPQFLLPLELGQITPEDYLAGLKSTLNLPWSYQQFVRAWNGIFAENRDVTSLAQRLAKRYRLMALTNTNVLHLDYIRTNIASLSVFSEWFASCNMGCRKPQPEIYSKAMARASVTAEQAVYIDDRPEMVEAGRRAGLTAIRFEDSRQLERDLRQAGVEL